MLFDCRNRLFSAEQRCLRLPNEDLIAKAYESSSGSETDRIYRVLSFFEEVVSSSGLLSYWWRTQEYDLR